MSTRIAARRVYLDGAFSPATVVIDDGVITAVEPFDAAATTVLPGDAVLLPGLVDSHVHLDEPGRTEWEGFATGTAAAAAGGVTTVVDMPLNSSPVTTTPEALDAKRQAAAGKLAVDVAYWGGAVPENLGSLRTLSEAGVVGFKCFLSPSGIDEFGYLDTDQLERCLAELAEFDGLLIVHAEDPAHLHADGALGPRYRDFEASRPPLSERAAIRRVIDAARRTGARAHIVHVSDGGALDDVRAAKAEGVRLTVETCPHYLTLDAEDVPDGAGAFKCCPPIRGGDNRDLLWAGIVDGTIDAIVSDHSPATVELKGNPDFGLAWGGIAGLQTGLSAVHTTARERGLAFESLLPLLTTGPARIAGLGGLGVIEPGAPGHLVAFAPDETFVVDAATLEYRNPVTPWHGKTLTGVVRETWLRGESVYRRGAAVTEREGREILHTPRGGGGVSAAAAATGPRGSAGDVDGLSHHGSATTGTGGSAAATEVPEPVEGPAAHAEVEVEVPELVEGTGPGGSAAATEVPEPVEGTGPGTTTPVPILQPGVGPVPGDHYLRATPDTVLWGRLPCASDTAVLEITSGASVTFDTVSHEGILDDQGKDPAAFFAAHGIPREQVLDDAVEIAASVSRDVMADGPHVVVGPVHVRDAHPGDLLKITVETLVPRVPYGVISNRHGKGALVGELPRGEHNVSVFAAVAERGGILHGTLPVVEGGEPVVAFPLAPFLGTMGVAVAGAQRPHSVPPGTHGGNIDINLLVEGTILYLPVQVEGALAYVGDPHFAQGDGEVALTALEASLRATLRFEVVPAAAARAAFGEVTGPLVRTPDYLVPTGMDPDLDAAMRACVRSSLALLHGRWGMDEHLGYAYLSAATDFDISQVVDIVSGVHARIREADFAGVRSVEPEPLASVPLPEGGTA